MSAMVRVCWSPPCAQASTVPWLDVVEGERFGGLRRVEDRRRFLTSRILLKTLVGQLSDTSPALVRLSYHCPRCGRPHGRPIVVEPPAAVRWHVSLSHTDRHVMVAATHAGPVGVDVEQVAATGFKGFDDVALSSAERRVVEGCAPGDRARARTVYWARKEAVLKATGRGLAVDPCALEVSAPHLPAVLTAWRADDPPNAPVQLTDVLVDDDHVAAVAVLAHAPCPVVLQPLSGSSCGQIRQG